MNALEVAKLAVRTLQSHAIPAVIAGGAARDIHLNRVPKDYDIVVLCNCDMGDVLDALDVVSNDLTAFGDGASMTAADHALNLDWVVKCSILGVSVDVIKQPRLPTTPEQVVEGFDCTLNMVWLDDAGVPVLHPRFPQPGGTVEMLELCDFPEARAAYLSKKFPEYIWPMEIKCAVA